MRKQTQEKIRTWLQEPDTKEIQREYLKVVCTSKVLEAWHDMAKYEHFKQTGCTELYLLYGQYIQDDMKKLMNLKKKLMTKPMTNGEVTQEMINAAKNYSFEDLYPFKRGMALCPFHPDSTPSMSLKNNRVRCWSCMDKSMDTIEFTMKLDGITFPQAVRKLQ